MHGFSWPHIRRAHGKVFYAWHCSDSGKGHAHADLRTQQKNAPAGPFMDLAILDIPYSLDEEEDAAEHEIQADPAAQVHMNLVESAQPAAGERLQ